MTGGIIMVSSSTADICDSNKKLLANGDIRILQPIFRIYGKRRVFSGTVVTCKVYDNNMAVWGFLETDGKGRILVIDGGGSMNSALVGGILSRMAQDNGWAGIVVNGCIRDVDDVNDLDIGVRAIASHPKKPAKKGVNKKHVTVNVAGALIRDGEWLYADSDGIIVSKAEVFSSSEFLL